MSFKAGHSVIELQRYRKVMKNPVLTELLNHWECSRAGCIAPLRSEIDPSEIENVLEHVFILEQVANGLHRFRIAGMRLTNFMGMKTRGMTATAIITEDNREIFKCILNCLFSEPEIIELHLGTSPANQTDKGAEILLLPIKKTIKAKSPAFWGTSGR